MSLPDRAAQTERRLRIIGWTGAILLAIGIFLESSSSDIGSMLPNLPPGSDKVAHAFSYALLSACLTLATARPGIAVVASGLYGLSDEFHQSFVPRRTSDVFDLVADVVGAVIGALAVVFLRRRLAKRRIE